MSKAQRNLYHLILAIVLLVSSSAGLAQTYDYFNQWYRFDQNYIKIQVHEDGVYRVSRNDLVQAGVNVAGMDPDNIQIFHRGREIAAYVQKSGNDLDYLEFFGRRNDGHIDSLMYRSPYAQFRFDPEQQPNRFSSYFTDTTTYFVTWDSIGTQRLAPISPTNYSAYSPEPWYRYRVLTEYKNKYFEGGGGSSDVNHILNPDYITGEGYIGGQFQTGDQIDVVLKIIPTPGFANSGRPTRIAGRSVSTTTASQHIVAIDIDGTDVDLDTSAGVNIRTQEFDYFQPLNAQTFFRWHAYGQSSRPDKNQPCWNYIEYDRNFDLDGAFGTVIREYNEPDTTYLRFYNADVGTEAWVIDPTNQNRIRGMVSGDTLHFLVPGSPIERVLYVYTDQAVQAPHIDPRTSLANLSNPDGGAEFVIITHERFSNSAAQYARYRDTCTVNQLSSKVVYVDQIMDEFGYGSLTSWAIKNFCKYAIDNWNTPPRYFLLWGKGRYAPRHDWQYNYVPSFGKPANDYEYVSNYDRNVVDLEPVVPIGRVSIYEDREGLDYLKKVDEYEHMPYAGWMKESVMLGGGKTNTEQDQIQTALVGQFKPQLEANPLAGTVDYYQKVGNGIESNSEKTSEQRINEGVGLIHFFGHSSQNVFDVDIQEANRYKNWNKYPFMIAFGCYGGNYVEREQSFGERFILEPDRGSIGYLANTTAGFLAQLRDYGNIFYQEQLGPLYGAPLGDVLKSTAGRYADEYNAFNNILAANHAKQVNLQGDPSVVLRLPQKPELSISDPDIFFTPENFSALDPEYTLNLVVHNEGRTFSDSFVVTVSHRAPNGETVEYEARAFGPVEVMDTFQFPIKNIFGPSLAGLNSYTVYVDALDSLDEYYEDNNLVVHDELIQGNIPAILYPYEYAVVKDASVKLSASTFTMTTNDNLQYVYEIDTVHTFDSPFKQSSGPVPGTAVFSEWEVPFSLGNDQVYYWRVRLANIYPIQWNTSSFKHVPGKTGWSQSRPPQFYKDPTEQVEISDLTREWRFEERSEQLHAFIHSFGQFNGKPEYFLGTFAANGEPPPGIMYTSIDRRTLQPDVRDILWGDWHFLAAPGSASSNSLADLVIAMTNTKEGDYFLICSSLDAKLGDWEDSWFRAMEMIGVDYDDVAGLPNGTRIIILGEKGAAPGTAVVVKEANLPVGQQAPRHDLLVDLTSNFSEGTVSSTQIGPTNSWAEYQFDWGSMDPFLHESMDSRVYGVRSDKTEEVLLVDLSQGNHDLATVDAETYPFLRIEGRPSDPHYLTAPQLNSWEVFYTPVGDAAVDPTIGMSIPDTIEEGQIVTVDFTARNVSDYDMDSLLVRFSLQRADRSYVLLGEQRYAALPAKTTQPLQFKFHSARKNLEEGLVSLVIELNPGLDQPEQYAFNNFFFRDLYVKTDKIGPILDVTVDGKHLMDGDIVSPEPEIVIEVNDDNRYLPVAVSDSTYRLWFGTERTFNLNPQLTIKGNEQIESIPGRLPKNKARLIFRPDRLGDGEYTLAVQGFDSKGNDAGKTEYVIHFNVVNEKAISKVLNYPNPFSSSTQFVYTLTGDEKPYVFEILIYTITGRLVKTIDLLELGEVNFGYNITDFAWDGRDEFGDLLANGVYLYKVNAKFRDRFGVKEREEGIEDLFRNGYGKMYIMR